MNLVAYLAQGQHIGAGVPLHGLTHDAPTQETLGRAAQALMLSFLLTSGGACRHPFVVASTSENAGEDEASIRELALWDAAALVPLQLGARASHVLQCLQDAFSQDLRIRLPGPELQSGEPFFYHALYLRVHTDERLRYFASALRRASPLTRLCSCPVVDEHPLVTCAEGQEGRPALTREEAEGLIAHPAMIFLRGYLADQWSTIETPVPSMSHALHLARLNARYATLLLALNSGVHLGKLAMLSVFPLFFQRLLERHYVAKIQAVMQISQWRISDREELTRGYLGLLALGTSFEEHFLREVIQPGAYGWQHPLQTRILVRKYGRLWSTGGLGAQVREAHLTLRGQMG